MKKFWRQTGDEPRPLTHHELHIWALQLHVMVSAGVPLFRALESIERSQVPVLAPACERLAVKVSEGYTMSEAMRALKPTFSDFAVNMIRVAERTGQLHFVLERLSVRSARRDKMNRALKGALAYPVFLAAVCIALALFMAGYMFPKMLPFLNGLGANLPWPTLVLQWGTRHLAPILLAFTVLAAAGASLLATSSDPRIQRIRAWLLYRSPVFGELNQNRVYADCFGDLYLLVSTDAGIMNGLESLRPPWPEFQQRVRDAIKEIRAGAGFSQAMRDSGALPGKFYMQVKAGEETGKLAQIFKRLADFLDESVTARTAQIVQLLEPAILLVMGLITGFVVLAVFLPIYTLATVH